MSLHRLIVELNCWPVKHPPRQAPGRMKSLLAGEAMPAQSIELLEVVLEGDSIQDCEHFDRQIVEGLEQAAHKVLAIPMFKLDQLRAMGYATRLDIQVAAEPGSLELTLPSSLIEACGKRGLGIQFNQDQVVMTDPTQSDQTSEPQEESEHIELPSY